jgi:hypothetical protein
LIFLVSKRRAGFCDIIPDFALVFCVVPQDAAQLLLERSDTEIVLPYGASLVPVSDSLFQVFLLCCDVVVNLGVRSVHACAEDVDVVLELHELIGFVVGRQRILLMFGDDFTDSKGLTVFYSIVNRE